MSDSEEEEHFCFFGKPIEPYDEDSFPKKKPISVEDQIATDAQGRRRFHGAFTGGFSAGFFNTVGSLEGWTPSEFKSTRQDKAANKKQKPEDFMDDEDIGEFGIAPQTVKATKDYDIRSKKRKRMFSDGPIPGEPVLHSLLSCGNETIGYMLLRNIGLKAKKAEEERVEEEEEEQQRKYGCEMPKTFEIARHQDIDEYPIDAIYKEYLAKPKDNTFGLGYTGLDKSSSHINLFQSAKLVITDKNKKKVSISGQAFGVGAFEDDDDDIYVKDDMSKYDFELTSEKKTKKTLLAKSEKLHLEDFVPSKNLLPPREVYPLPKIPHSFTGKHKVKKSRFEPLPAENEPVVERKNMNPAIRAKYLGEEVEETAPAVTPSTSQEIKKEPVDEETETKPKLFDILSASGLVFDRFVSASKSEDVTDILQEVTPVVQTEHGTHEMREAARMKMFGPLTRISTDWQPFSLLCRRFNVPEPNVELNAGKSRKRTKNLIFEYEQHKDETPELLPGLSIQAEKAPEEGETTVAKIEPPEEPQVEQNKSSFVDFTEKIDVAQNIDLFKAVFLSSSESEGEDEEKEKVEEEKKKETASKNAEMKINIISNTLLVPRIKPIKEGILSNMDFGPPVAETKINSESVALSVKLDPDSYGPSLPEVVVKKSAEIVKVQVESSGDNDEWVEKPKRDKKHKSGKKHKKQKSSSSHKKKRKKRSRDR